MTLRLNYPDTATFAEVGSSGYAGKKAMVAQFECPVIFVQSTDFRHNNFRDEINADAVCYPDPTNEFVMSYANRLEGMYVLMPLYGAADNQSWFKISKVTVNRDHLLNNTIDNIELQLKKSTPVPGVS